MPSGGDEQRAESDANQLRQRYQAGKHGRYPHEQSDPETSPK